MFVTITEKHLKKAIENQKLRGKVSTCQTCIVSEAVSESFGEEVFTSYQGDHKGHARKVDEFPMNCAKFENTKVVSVMVLFDSQKYEAVRAMLPLTFELIYPNQKGE